MANPTRNGCDMKTDRNTTLSLVDNGTHGPDDSHKIQKSSDTPKLTSIAFQYPPSAVPSPAWGNEQASGEHLFSRDATADAYLTAHCGGPAFSASSNAPMNRGTWQWVPEGCYHALVFPPYVPSLQFYPLPMDFNSDKEMHKQFLSNDQIHLSSAPHQDTQRLESTKTDWSNIMDRLQSRPNPQFTLSRSPALLCAMTISDIRSPEQPIEDCTPLFEKLTGYTKEELIGRNCRLLQSPNGDPQKIWNKQYSDQRSINHLRECIRERKEAQVALINYRKTGQPFVNLLTIMPLADTAGEVTHYVGFAADILVNPAILATPTPSGSHNNVDYGFSEAREPSEKSKHTAENSAHATGSARRSAMTPASQDVADLLRTQLQINSEIRQQVGYFNFPISSVTDEYLLENIRDVVIVVNQRQIILYLSSACLDLLGYDPNDLVGKPLSEICHPSDIVSTTRKLQNKSGPQIINFLLRCRRQSKGYCWLEFQGGWTASDNSAEQYAIMLGRETFPYSLDRNALSQGGSEDQEACLKVSTSGIILYITTNSQRLLGKTRDELIGTSFFHLFTEPFRRNILSILAGVKPDRRMFCEGGKLTSGSGSRFSCFFHLVDAGSVLKAPYFFCRLRLDSRKIIAHRPPLAYRKSSHNFFPPETSSQPDPVNIATSMTHSPKASDSESDFFAELNLTRSTSWEVEIRTIQAHNEVLKEEMKKLSLAKKKRDRKKKVKSEHTEPCVGCGAMETPEWRRGAHGKRDLCNACGLKWAKIKSKNAKVKEDPGDSDG